MMPTEYTTRYDEAGDMLVIKKKDTKIQRTISVGNMNIDFDTDRKIIGIQLLNASEVIVFPEKVESPTEFLKNIHNTSLRAKYFEDGSAVIIATVEKEENGETLQGLLNTQTPAVTA